MTPQRVPTLDELWTRTRQGARNVAGVRFQTAVAAYLLAGAATESEVVVQVKPEGLEDIDCRRRDGRSLFVQVKERGASTFSAADVAAAIVHARSALDASAAASLAIVTNAPLASGLPRTGWDGTLGRSIDEAMRKRLENALSTMPREEARGLLDRCHLVELGWEEATTLTRTVLANAFGLPGAAADLLRARLLDDLLHASASQRGVSAAKAAVRTRADVEAAAARVKEMIDVAGIDAAVTAGLVEHIDFTRALEMPLERFLTGVDVLPGHIAAHLDLLRVDELTALFGALAENRYVVIAGPSGSGKSALLWRAARELSDAHRVVRVRRIAPDDVASVSRWVRTLHPAPETPVLVCADDLGRPGTAAWPDLAARLLEEPGVRLLGCAREEDFTPSLVAFGGLPLRPQLSSQLADEVEAQLLARGVAVRMTAREALPEASGLLMEFVAMLTTGDRLEQVVTKQVHERLSPDRRVERDVLRFVAAAHRAGLDLQASTLRDLCRDPPDLQQALVRLSQEFLVRQAGDSAWGGLHELRSAVVHRVLHEIPPPTEEETLCALVSRLGSPEAAHLLRQTADRGGALDAVIPTVIGRMADQRTTAPDASAWLDAAIAVDVGGHVRSCLATIPEAWPRPDIPILRFAWLRRFARLPDDWIPEGLPLDELAAVLPNPSTDFAKAIARAVRPERLTAWLQAAAPTGAVILSEAFAAAGGTELDAEQAKVVLAAHCSLGATELCRLVKALWVLTPDSHGNPAGTFGPRNVRLDRLANANTSILRWSTEPDPDELGGLLARLAIFVPAGDLSEDQVRELGRQVLDLCPEVSRVQVEPRGPRGFMGEVPVRGGGRLHRSTYLNPRIEGRRARLMSEALERARAAASWAERFSQQRQVVDMLTELVEQTFDRLLTKVDNPKRREAWRAAVNDARSRVDALPAPPLPSMNERGFSDPARDTLERIVLELKQIATTLDRPETFSEHGSALRRAFSRFWLPYRDTENLSDAGLAAQIAGLREPVMLLADLLSSLAMHPSLVHRGRQDRKTTYRDVAEAVVKDTRDTVLAVEKQALLTALPAQGITLTLVGHRDEVPGGLVDDIWLIGCNPALWDEVLHEAPERLRPDVRAQLAGRLVAIYEVSGILVPAVAFRIDEEHARSISAEDAQALARSADVAFLQDPQVDAVLELRETLVSVSALSANMHQREIRFDHESLAAQIEPLLSRAEELAASLEMPPDFPPAVEALLGLARDEFEGSAGISQAAGMAVLSEFAQNSIDSLVIDQVVQVVVATAVRRALGV